MTALRIILWILLNNMRQQQLEFSSILKKNIW